MTKPAVLITGAAKRLGATMAQRFADAGWHVVIHYRGSAHAAQALCDALPSAQTVQADLSDAQATAAMADDLAARLPDWRAVVNSASLFEYDDARAIDSAIFARAMHTNAAGPVLLAQRFLARANAAQGKRVINVLDQKLWNANPDFFSYSMSKAALGMATRMLAMEHRGSADRIYGLAPGAMLPSHDQQADEHQTSGRMNLLQRLTRPEELADAAVFLAQGHLASGETICVDSGQHLLDQPRDVLFMARAAAGA
jgi:NAD(P)-dependent dehydrogenase (short-subunit alcohol dehydrogenase family)